MAKKAATATKEKDNGKSAGGWAAAEGRAERNAGHLARIGETVTSSRPIIVPAMDTKEAQVKLVGDSELIVHNWSAKALKEMLAKQMGLATAGREKKDPVADFLGSLYTIEPGEVVGKFDIDDLDAEGHPKVTIKGGKFGVPAIAFKNAAVTACTSIGKTVIPKTQARQSFHVIGEMVPIIGTPRMRMDMVRLTGGTADIRFRAGFKEWSVVICIRFNSRLLTIEQIANLFNTAGFGVGICEWRAERDGWAGQFHVA